MDEAAVGAVGFFGGGGEAGGVDCLGHGFCVCWMGGLGRCV